MGAASKGGPGAPPPGNEAAVAAPGSRATERADRPAADDVSVAADSVPLVDDMAPLWPDESAESAMMSELGSRGEMARPAATEAIEETDTAPLPPLDQLVKRLPPEVRATLDELFRATFVTVRRVPKNALKN